MVDGKTMIDGKTMVCGLIGDPVEHTLSPVIHNTLARENGKNLVYVPFHVKGEQVETPSGAPMRFPSGD